MMKVVFITSSSLSSLLLLLPLVLVLLPSPPPFALALPDAIVGLTTAGHNIIVETILDATANIVAFTEWIDDDDDVDDDNQRVGKQQPQGQRRHHADDDDPGPFFTSWQEEDDYYGPVDRFWRHNAITKQLTLGGDDHDDDTEGGGIDYYPILEECLASHPKWQQQQIQQEQNLTQRLVTERFLDIEGKGPIVLVAIENAISPIHAQALQALEECVRQQIPYAYESRPLSEVYQDTLQEMGVTSPQDKAKLGGNNPTHMNVLINLFLPALVKEIYKTLELAFDAAGWQAIVVRDEVLGYSRAYGKQAKPKHLGIRAAEYLRYDGFTAGLGPHVDGDVNSMVMTLFLEDNYTGGEFYIEDALGDIHQLPKKPPKYSALVFKGGQYTHGIRPLSGQREAFAIEFWNYPDLPFGHNLCVAEATNMEEHIVQCNPIQKGEYDTQPCNKEFPSSYTTYGVCHSSWISSSKTKSKSTTSSSTTTSSTTTTSSS